MVVHSILSVLPGTMPPHLQGLMRMGRLNITFRDVSDGRLDTSLFPMYRVLYDGDEGSLLEGEGQGREGQTPTTSVASEDDQP